MPGSNPQSVNAGREIRNPNDEPDSGNSNTRDPDAGWPAHVLTWIKDVRKEIGREATILEAELERGNTVG